MIKIFSYHCVKNEEKNIKKILTNVINQTIPIDRIVVVNDGSEDKTSEIAKNMGVEVIDLPNEHKDRRSTGDFAKLPNFALAKISKKYDYILNSGGDHLLPSDYLEKITNEMNKNKKLGVCSGYVKDEYSVTPRGSGRVTRFEIFKSINFKFPIKFGYESYLLYKSNQLGFENKVLNIETSVLRPTKKTYTKDAHIAYGKSYHALGYFPLFVMAYLLMESKRSLSGSYYQLVGYLDNKTELHDKDIREYISNKQKTILKNKMKNMFRIR